MGSFILKMNGENRDQQQKGKRKSFFYGKKNHRIPTNLLLGLEKLVKLEEFGGYGVLGRVREIIEVVKSCSKA